MTDFNDSLTDDELFKIDNRHPKPSDINLQYKLYKKKELYSYRIKHRPEFNNYNDLKKYRNFKCSGKIELANQQIMLANYFNSQSPQTGILIFHGLGSGKTCAAITIAETFKQQVIKYNTKIYVLVPGPNIRDVWKREVISCTGNVYLNDTNNFNINNKKNVSYSNQSFYEYYKFMSYKSFYKRVLGEKIRTIDISSTKKYQKTDEGEYLRASIFDKIENLNNSLLIIDEAHNITGNSYLDAVKTIINNSKNLKVLLLTGTPMKNSADDIIDLINLLKPKEQQLVRSKIFNNENIHNLDFTDINKDGESGIDYFRKNIRGYVSYLKGGDEYIFAKRNDVGIVSKHLKFTKIIPCKMSKFQKLMYDQVVLKYDDSLEKASGDVANFVYPLLNLQSFNDDTIHDIVNSINGGAISWDNNEYQNNSEIPTTETIKDLETIKESFKKKNTKSKDTLIVPSHSISGMNNVIFALTHNKKQFNEELVKFLSAYVSIEDFDVDNLIYLSKERKPQILGSFLDERFLHIFSTKFHKALRNINKLVYGKKLSKPTFIYSNLVVFGINLFKQIMIQNGYLEFTDTTVRTYEKIQNNTRCYFCGYAYVIHKNNQLPTNIPNHEYSPACFISITGKDDDENISDSSRDIINNIFNNSENYEGRYIKFVLGSRVLSEGFSLKNIGEVHLLDVWYNFARVEQVVGRAIRTCSHKDVMTPENPYPKVNVYKYCIVLDSNKPTTEELLYQKAEKKHILIKQVERILKEEAFDCAINYNGNTMDRESINDNKNCIPIESSINYDSQTISSNDKYCPVECDYMNCEFQCSNDKLNHELYNENTQTYRDLQQHEIDTTTFNVELFIQEIIYCKRKIKEMYILKYIYTLSEIVDYIKESYENKQNFDIYYIYKALDDLIPISENEFNNFTDIIVDRYNRPGYLIYANKFYIFQVFGESEAIPMNYRITSEVKLNNDIELFEYMKYNNILLNYDTTDSIKEGYDFESVIDYYSKKKEFNYVGIIDKEPNRKKNKTVSELNDIFKLRERIKIQSNKKRLTGLQTFVGSVCFNSYSMNYIKKVFKTIGIPFNDKLSRIELCELIKNKLLDMEKYNNDNYTYVIIPANHPYYPFPYNLKDRSEFIKDKIINKFTGANLSITYDAKHKHYNLLLQSNNKINTEKEFLKEIGFVNQGKVWQLTIK